MASRTPIIGQKSIAGSIPLAALLIAAMTISAKLGHSTFPGLLVVVGLFYRIRLNFPRDQRIGMRKIKKGNYEAAIPHFQKSLERFQENPWMDRCRSIIFLSTGPMTFREMALVNSAWAYSQIGQRNKAIEWYEKALLEYPDSQIAITALRMLKDPEVQSGPRD